METFPRYWPFVRGIHRSPVNSPHKCQWGRTFMFSLICGRINGWVNKVEAGELIRHRAHLDVIVMWSLSLCTSPGGRGAQALFWRAVLFFFCGCFGVVVTSFSAMLLSWSLIFWMLVAVVLSLFRLSEYISLLSTLYSPTRCRTSQSSRTCFSVSTGTPHALQLWFSYLFL